MLSELDESMHHQVALPFAQVATSDHRFYDRNWSLCFDPTGSASIALGMGVYKNMNVTDAHACAVVGSTQTNVRSSRPLRPDLTSDVPPIRLEVVRPFEELRYTVTPGDHPLAADLVWTASIPPFLEGRWEANDRLLNGRQERDTQRFWQTGRWNGWMEVGGRRFDVQDWCGLRDHSWGVRPGIGGFEPINGPSAVADGGGWFLGVLCFNDGRGMAGHVAWTEGPDGARRSFEGRLRWERAANRPEIALTDVQATIRFIEGSRDHETAVLGLEAEDGSTYEVATSRPLRGTVLKGYGGHGKAWKDERGYGFYRGHLVESEVYDLTSPEHRNLPAEGAVLVSVDGRPGGWGDFTILAAGALPRHGLQAQTVEELVAYGKGSDNLGAD